MAYQETQSCINGAQSPKILTPRVCTCFYSGCGATFDSRLARYNHGQTCPFKKEFTYALPSCGRVFNTKEYLESHKAFHFECETCDRFVAGKLGLNAHAKSIHSEDPYITCPVPTCSIVIKLIHSEQVELHLLEQHKGLKACPICGNSLSMTLTILSTIAR